MESKDKSQKILQDMRRRDSKRVSEEVADFQKVVQGSFHIPLHKDVVYLKIAFNLTDVPLITLR
jgi:hypothetical protein